MRSFLVLLGRELAGYFHSAVGYVVLFFFLLLTGFNFYMAVVLVNELPSDTTLLEAFFNMVFFWFAYILAFPLLTMRLFSEEYKMGTIEPLMTAPVGDLQVVLAKFIGALIFYVILWVPSLLYFLVFERITGEQAAVAPGPYFGAYLMLLLVGMFYLSIGCLASALTRNQIIAGVLSFVVIALLFAVGVMSRFLLTYTSMMRDLVAYFSTVTHMIEFSEGILDTRPIVFYLSLTLFVLFLTYHVFQRRRWSN